MLALQGTLTTASFHCVSSMDQHGSGYASPSSSMGWRMRASSPRQQAQLPPEQAGLEVTGRSGERSILTHCVALIRSTIEHPQIGAHPNRPASAHPSRPPSTYPAYQHHEHSPSPVPSSPSSGFAQPHAPSHRQGIAPQPMRYAFTHPGGWPDHSQRFRTRGSAGSSSRVRTSRPSSYLGSTSSHERLGKRKRPASAERGTATSQAVTAHRDSVGPQRSHRRHHNVAEKTHSTMLPSGGMYMTFPLDIPSPEPDAESSAPAGPPPFEHGPTELPPRTYEARAEGEVSGSGPERPAKRGRLPADVMDHVSTQLSHPQPRVLT